MGRKVKISSVKPFAATAAPKTTTKTNLVASEFSATLAKNEDGYYDVAIGFTTDRRHVITKSTPDESLIIRDEIVSIDDKPVKLLSHQAVIRKIKMHKSVQVIAARYPLQHPKRSYKTLTKTSLAAPQNPNQVFVPGAVVSKGGRSVRTRNENSAGTTGSTQPVNDLASEIQKARAVQAKLQHELHVWSEIDSQTSTEQPRQPEQTSADLDNLIVPSKGKRAWGSAAKPSRADVSSTITVAKPPDRWGHVRHVEGATVDDDMDDKTMDQTLAHNHNYVKENADTVVKATPANQPAMKSRAISDRIIVAGQVLMGDEKELEDAKKKLEDAERRARGYQAARDAALKESEGLKAETNSLKAETKNLKAEVTELKKKNTQLQQPSPPATTLASELSDVNNEKTQKLKETIVALEYQNEQLKTQLAAQPIVVPSVDSVDSFLKHEIDVAEETNEKRFLDIEYSELGMGINFAGPSIRLHDGDSDLNGFFISEVQAGRAADTAGAKVGDRVISVNGLPCKDLLMVHVTEAISKLWKDRTKLRLEVIHSSASLTKQRRASQTRTAIVNSKGAVDTRLHEARRVVITKDEKAQIGISLIGSVTADQSDQTKRGVHVKSIAETAPAFTSGLMVGDRILAVGQPENSCEGKDYAYVAKMIKHCGSTIVLRVIDDEAGHFEHEQLHKDKHLNILNKNTIPPTPVVKKPPTPMVTSTPVANKPTLPVFSEGGGQIITAILTRTAKTESFGFGMGKDIEGRSVVSQVGAKAPADGKLQLGDVIKTVNGRMVDSMDHEGLVSEIIKGLSVTIVVDRPPSVDVDSIVDETMDETVNETMDETVNESLVFEEHTVTLKRASTTDGFGFGLGTTDEAENIVTSITSRTPADGLLFVSDIVVTINGKNTSSMEHSDIISEICSGLEVVIAVKRCDDNTDVNSSASTPVKQSQLLPEPDTPYRVDDLRPIPESNTVTAGGGTITVETKEIEVMLKRDSLTSSYGFGIGTTDDGFDIVTSIVMNGPADNKLQVQDVIFSIDQKPTGNYSHSEVIAELVKDMTVAIGVRREVSTDSPTSMKIGRKQETISQVRPALNVSGRIDDLGSRAYRDLEFNLTRADLQSSFGFGLGTTATGKDKVTNVQPASPADGKLEVNDLLITIDGKSVATTSHDNIISTISKTLAFKLGVRRALSPEELAATVHNVNQVGIQMEVEATLTRPDEQTSYGFGLGVFGSEDIVTSVIDNSPADGKLEVDDVLVSVNGLNATELEHDVIIGEIKKGTSVELTVMRMTYEKHTESTARHPSISIVNPQARVSNREDNLGSDVVITNETIVLKRKDTSSGFGLKFGSTDGIHIITYVHQGGSGDGKIEILDELKMVNGKSTAKMDHEEVCAEISSSLQVTFVVSRSSSPKDHELHVNFKLTRTDASQSYGFVFGSTNHGNDRVLAVTKDTPAFGKLEVNDIIVCINDEPIKNVKHEDSVSKISEGTEVSLVLKRTISSKESDLNMLQNRVASRRLVDNTDKHNQTIINFDLTRADLQSSFGMSIATTNLGHHVISHIDEGSAVNGKLQIDDLIATINDKPTSALEHKTLLAQLSQMLTVKIGVKRAKQIIVNLKRPSKAAGFGFGLGTSNQGNSRVTNILEGSGAVGCVAVNDMIVAINGVAAKTLSHEEIVYKISAELEVELIVQRSEQDRLSRSESISSAIPGMQVLQRFDNIGKVDTNFLMVTLSRPDKETSYGLVLGTTNLGNNIVANVLPNSPAVDKLYVEDVITAIDGESVTGKTHEEVVAAIGGGVVVKLTIIRPKDHKDQLVKVVASLSRPTKSDSYGFGIGSTQTGEDRVVSVDDNGPADGKVEVNDELFEVNGESALSMTHDELIEQLTSGTTVDLVVRRMTYLKDPTLKRNESISKVQPKLEIMNRMDNIGEETTEVMVNLVRPDMQTSWGFGIGTTDRNNDIVTHIVEKGLAYNSELEVEDVLISINGATASELDHAGIIAAISGSLKLELEVQRQLRESDDELDAMDTLGENKRTSISQVDHSLVVHDRINDLGLQELGLQEMEVVSVELTRKDMQTSFGFGLATTNKGNDLVSNVFANSPADGALEVKDIIVAVNGESAEFWTHDQVIAALSSATTLKLDVKRAVNIERTPIGSKHDSISKLAPQLSIDERDDQVGAIAETEEFTEVHVVLERDDVKTSFGFAIGSDEQTHFVTTVIENSPASGKLEVHDELASIDGKDANTLSHDDVYAAVKGAISLQLVVRRLPKETWIQSTIMSVSVTLEREAATQSYGFGLDNLEDNTDRVSVVCDDGIAFGKLFVGDQLLKVNGENVVNATHDETVAKVMTGTSVTIEVNRNFIRDVAVIRTNGSMGIAISGPESVPNNENHVADNFYITFRKEGLGLNRGDRVLAIDGESCEGRTLADIQKQIVAIESEVVLQVKYDGVNFEKQQASPTEEEESTTSDAEDVDVDATTDETTVDVDETTVDETTVDVDAIANDVDDTSFVEHEAIAQQPEPEETAVEDAVESSSPFFHFNNISKFETAKETADREEAVEDAMEEVVEEAVEEVNLIEGMTKEDYDIYKDMQALTEEEEALPEMDRDMIRLEKEEEASLFKRKAKKAN